MMVDVAGRVLIASIVVISAICVAIPVSYTAYGETHNPVPHFGRKTPIQAIDVPNWPPLLRVVVFFGNCVVDLHLRANFQCAQHLIGTAYDLLPFVESAADLDVSRALNAGF